MRVHRNALADITEGGSKKQISDFAIEKLGDFKRTKTTVSRSSSRTGTRSTKIDNLTGKKIKKDIKRKEKRKELKEFLKQIEGPELIRINTRIY